MESKHSLSYVLQSRKVGNAAYRYKHNIIESVDSIYGHSMDMQYIYEIIKKNLSIHLSSLSVSLPTRLLVVQ